ncbi:MAG TPA: peptide chain release factor-like protein, partial [Polyangia bacterium]|nr:peptide chain release factor-like protein [Polyangia bacterium]
GFEIAILDARRGLKVFRAVGPRAAAAFRDEAGGHRWQRIPPNEKHGRVHTSTITVAVLPEPTEVEVRIAPGDLDWSYCLGTGPGGQTRNKTACTVLLTHRPTGLQVRCETTRSQHHNRIDALALLRAKLWAREHERVHAARAQERRDQLGSGMRGDKRRTIRCQDGTVVDHVTGRRWELRQYLRGNW